MSRSAATGLWPTLSTASSLEELVEAVLDVGLRNLPTIAIAYRADAETHVLLRGAARGAVGAEGSEPVQILASDAQTWKEHAVTGPVQLFLGELSEGGDLPLRSGVVPADALSVDWSAPAIDRPKTVVPPPDVVPPSTETDAEVLDEPAIAEQEAEVAEVAAVFMDAPDAAGGATILESPVESEPADYPDSTLTEGDLLDLDGARTELPVEPGPPPSGNAPIEEEDNFDDLFGATRLPLPVERAAVRSETNDTDLPPVASSSAGVPSVPDQATDHGHVAPEALSPSAFLPPRAHGPAGSSVAPPPAAGHALIDGVPGVAPVQTSAPPAPVPPAPSVVAGPSSAPDASPIGGRPAPDDDPEEDPSMTVSRASLGKCRTTGMPPASSSGPTVQGVWCDVGHPNPAAAATCRSCGLPIELVDAVSMPRPVLGVLRFSNGIEVELDRSVIVGRSPKAERVSAREIPQLVTVPSPDKDISRNHLEVKLDGWHVIVVDLGSTNGTVVTLPGQPPERLRASEEQPISPGTVITIAEEITFVYEVPS
ncbi:MAG: FHA domain-containing protein [Acidimicrobiales bacterium]